MATFKSLGLSAELLKVVSELGFTAATAVQEKSIPLLIEGKDVIAQAKTGSGKTAAFTLPILQKLAASKINLQKNVQIHAMVLCPTRELCTQVARDIRKLGRRQMGLQVLILSGGQPMGPQLQALEMGVHIVVGTPGRVLDHCMRRSLDLSTLNTLVLDEADRMLEMGFEDEMKSILENVPKTRQTMLFSATFPDSIAQIGKRYLNEPVRVMADDRNDDPPKIEQHWIEAGVNDRLKAIIWTLGKFNPDSTMVFCNFKASVVELTQALQKYGVSALALHGDLEQKERDSVMAKFRNESARVLVATDVAGRGIDVAGLDLVINYEIPKQNENYTHRIGRTGRAGKKGIAVILALPTEKSHIDRIEKFTDQKMRKLETTEPFLKLPMDDLKLKLHQKSKMETLFISGGRKNKVRAGDLLGALTGEAGGLKASDIGKIEIHDFFSYVAVATQVSRLAVERLRVGKIKGKRFRVELAK